MVSVLRRLTGLFEFALDDYSVLTGVVSTDITNVGLHDYSPSTNVVICIVSVTFSA
jgi:hypothetical protein